MPRSRTISEDMKQRLNAAGVCRVATTGPGGPHVGPFCHAFDGENTVYIETGPGRQTVRNLAHSNELLVLVDHYDDDWSQIWLISLSGTGRTLTEGAEFEKAAGLLNTKFPQFAAGGMAIDHVLAIDLTGVRHSQGVDRGES